MNPCDAKTYYPSQFEPPAPGGNDSLDTRLARLDRHAEHIELTVAAFEPKLEHLEDDQRQIAKKLQELVAIQQKILARLPQGDESAPPTHGG